ncbi:MAG: YpoC family protein, partial [Bacilli bacterium]
MTWFEPKFQAMMGRYADVPFESFFEAWTELEALIQPHFDKRDRAGARQLMEDALALYYAALFALNEAEATADTASFQW